LLPAARQAGRPARIGAMRCAIAPYFCLRAIVIMKMLKPLRRLPGWPHFRQVDGQLSVHLRECRIDDPHL